MNKKTIKYIVEYLVIALIVGLTYYIYLPAINLQNEGFWIFLSYAIFLCTLPFSLTVTLKYKKCYAKKTQAQKKLKNADVHLKLKRISFLALIPIAVMCVGLLISSTLFNARAYASVITVNQSIFEDDMPKTTSVTNIALMDTASAQKLGDKKLGSLEEFVSQYTVSEQFNQINFNNTPKKVAILEYEDFFKWLGNKNKGIPGYIMVDPTISNAAQYIEFKQPVKYAQSAYFGEDLTRKLRFSYPTKIFGEPRFEVDEAGNPVYIVPCLKPRIGIFGAKDVVEAIIFNPCTGESQIYGINDVPSWVDIVFNGDLAMQKYNWHGTLLGGFLNSIIGNKGCKQTTDDYGYLTLDNDVWYFTGVTSVSGDESNIGFILTNARTGYYKYYPVIGASEHAAMEAAEGEVQNMRYEAAFPALVNLYGHATYIMVLKDSSGIVKMYCLVNVEDYSNIIATGNTQEDAVRAYKDLLIEKGILNEVADSAEKKQITVLSVKETVIDGNTVFFFETEENGESVYYKLSIAKDESALFIKAGDSIYVTYEETDKAGIYIITSWSYEN